jgi:hypothetical protein
MGLSRLLDHKFLRVVIVPSEVLDKHLEFNQCSLNWKDLYQNICVFQLCFNYRTLLGN